MHNLILEKEYPTGALMCRCPTCGRQIVYKFSPEKLTSIVLEDGDRNVSHNVLNGIIPNAPVKEIDSMWTEIDDIISDLD